MKKEETMKKRIVFPVLPVLLLLTLSALPLFSQAGEPRAILAYAADDFEIEVVDATGGLVTDVYTGMDLNEGDTIRTNGTVAELSLDPNGSIIKLSSNTVFTIKELQKNEETENSFHMVAGKLRTIAARGTTLSRYRVSTPSAVCGVRGTDFGVISIPGSIEKAFVIDGLIDYQNAAGQSISLGAGQIADALAATFEAIKASQEQMQALVQDVLFEQLDPIQVPGHTPVDLQGEEEPAPDDDEASEEELAEDEAAEDEQDAETDAEAEADDDEESTEEDTLADEETGEDEGEGDTPRTVDTVADESGGDDTSADRRTAAGSADDGLLGALGDILGLEIGTMTIGEETFSKAVLQPVIEIGKLKAALYLPIIYTRDMFDPSDWYRPKGNDEWSFGTDQDWSGDPLGATQDIFSDLFLKIRYLEYGDNRDPFYLRFGNLRTMTIGHGILMRNYANDFDFPAIRRLGLNTGIKGDKIGFEAVVNDLAAPDVFGGRVIFRPAGKAFPLGFALSSIIDINPDSMVNPDDPEAPYVPSDMMLLGSAFDIEFPIIESDFLSMVLFGDAAAMLPIYDGTVQTDAIWDPDGGSFSESLKNYGVESGVFGNLLFVDYRLAYRLYDGVFRPTFFGPSYERLRGMYAAQTYAYIENPSTSDYDKVVMGVYGEGAATILDAVRLEAGYLWPWSPEGANPEEDELNITLTVLPDVIPVVNIYGSLTYSRTKFIPMLTGSSDESLSWFDAYSAFSGEIIYPVAPTLDIVLAAGTAIKYENGEPVYNSDGSPEMVPNLTLETRVHF